jgi:raffinose/stachyose/melibiose transport system substrate-binding protein
MALVLAACGGGGATASPSAESAAPPPTAAPTEAPPTEAAAEPVTIEFYDLHINEPGRTLLQTIIDEFEADHPNVTIDWVNLENEALKAKIATEMQAGQSARPFSRGAAVLAQQVEAGMARAIDADIAAWKDTMNPGAMSIYQVDGVQYGIPYNFGLVGFWYNKDLFAQAGISEPATTWSQFLTDVQKLKDAGITPISVGAGDKWPAKFNWAYLALRAGGQAALEGRRDRRLERAGIRHGRHRAQADRHGALPGLVPSRDVPADGGDDGQRQGRHGADGPVAPGVEKDNSESAGGHR